MPLKIEGITYGSYASIDEADFEQSNILDNKTIRIRFSLERSVFISPDNQIYLTPPIGVLESVDNVRIIYAPDDQLAFEEFQEGDEIVISYEGLKYYTIEEKINSQTIRVATSTIPLDTFILVEPNTFIACTKAPSALKYYYNFISDQDSIDYINHLDNETNLLTVSGINTTTVGYGSMLTDTGSKSHQIGSVRLDFVDRINDYKLVFEIVHRVRQYPFLKENYISLLEENKPLEDWAGDLSYSHIFNIEMLKELNVDKDKISLEYTENKGNTGAFNESFNTGNTGFSVESVEYKVGSLVVDSIDFNQLTKVKVVYKSNGQFTGTFKTELALLGVQEDYEYYKDKTQTYEQNFCLGVAGTSGIINLSTPYMVFTEYSHTIINADTLEINAKVYLGDAIKANLNKSEVKKYLLSVTSEISSNSPSQQVRSRDIVDIAEFSENLPMLNIISTNTKFWLDPAPLNSGFEFDSADTFMTDDVQAVVEFSYPESMPIKLLTITNQVIASDGTQEIILDSQVSPVSGYPLDPFGVQLINVDQLRPLNQSYKSNTVISRGTDTSGNRVFNIAFPFVVGYREDKPILGQAAPVEFFVNGAVGNGLSSDWYKYEAETGWSIYYRVKYTYEYLGKSYSQSAVKLFTIHDYDDPEWTAKSIKIYDENDIELINGSTKFIRGNCKIVAKFSKASMPVLGDCFAYFFIARTGEDGYRTSSSYDNTFKKIIFASIQIIAGELVVTGNLDANIIASNCRIWCRIFERSENPALECVLLTEDDYLFEEEGGQYYLQPETCEIVEADYWVDNLDNNFIDNEGNSFIIIN
jgi:hypothetical protein